MQFELVPVLEKMEELYQQPRNRQRFEAYLSLLQGAQKGDMILPIGGYNPMGKENVLSKIQELKALETEHIIEDELNRINKVITLKENRKIEVVLNLADDIGGAWTNTFTTNFTSKFDLNALVNRNFCTPYFWTSEDFTKDLVVKRTKEYVYRTIYWIRNGKPKTLKDHLQQEVYVANHSDENIQNLTDSDLAVVEKFYQQNLDSENYSLIFNFFYGDEASELLGYSTYGMKQETSIEYIKHLAKDKILITDCN